MATTATATEKDSGYYRCEVRVISRSGGGSATAAAAYRTRSKIHDERTGLTHDYRRRQGVERHEIITPAHAVWIANRERLWNAAELAEKRINSCVAREIIACFPHQLEESERIRAGQELGQWLARQYGVAVDLAWHRPGRTGDERNYHMHALMTTRVVTAEGMGEKTRILDAKASGGHEVTRIREQWATILNQALERNFIDVRVDHRSYEAQGIKRQPGVHLGKAATAKERQGFRTELGDLNRLIANDNHRAELLRQEIEKLESQLERQEIFDRTNAMTKPSDDRTRTAVARQLKGFSLQKVEIGVYDRATGAMINRALDADKILEDKTLGWLKQQNRLGRDIYVRPIGNSGFVLVDDLSLGALERLKRDGFQPAIITQTSEMNYQAWVKLSLEPLDSETATAAAKILAARYDGDPNSADWRHYGRLAGFTNRKPEHIRSDGRSPFVLLESYYGQIAAKAENLLQEARERVQANQGRKEPPKPSRAAENAMETSSLDELEAARAHFEQRYAKYLADFGNDASRADWHLCKDLAKRGISVEAITYGLRYGSPDLENRKKGHVEDYVNRTIDKMLEEPDVIEARRRQSAPVPRQQPPVSQQSFEEDQRRTIAHRQPRQQTKPEPEPERTKPRSSRSGPSSAASGDNRNRGNCRQTTQTVMATYLKPSSQQPPPLTPEGQKAVDRFIETYMAEAERDRYRPDHVKTDWTVCVHLAKEGHRKRDIQTALRQTSQAIREGQINHPDAYARGTVNRLWSLKEVREARTQLRRQIFPAQAPPQASLNQSNQRDVERSVTEEAIQPHLQVIKARRRYQSRYSKPDPQKETFKRVAHDIASDSYTTQPPPQPTDPEAKVAQPHQQMASTRRCYQSRYLQSNLQREAFKQIAYDIASGSEAAKIREREDRRVKEAQIQYQNYRQIQRDEHVDTGQLSSAERVRKAIGKRLEQPNGRQEAGTEEYTLKLVNKMRQEGRHPGDISKAVADHSLFMARYGSDEERQARSQKLVTQSLSNKERQFFDNDFSTTEEQYKDGVERQKRRHGKDEAIGEAFDNHAARDLLSKGRQRGDVRNAIQKHSLYCSEKLKSAEEIKKYARARTAAGEALAQTQNFRPDRRPRR